MEEAKDEEVVAEVIMKTTKSKSVNRTGVVVDKGETVEVGQVTVELSILSVTSMTIMQISANWSNVIVVIRPIM